MFFTEKNVFLCKNKQYDRLRRNMMMVKGGGYERINIFHIFTIKIFS